MARGGLTRRPKLKHKTPPSISLLRTKNGLDNGVHFSWPFRETGDPDATLRLQHVEEAQPASDEVLLQVLYSPINPSDLHMIRGRYGYQPLLPASPGGEEFGRLLLDCTEWFSVRYPHGLSVQEGEGVLDALLVKLLPGLLDAIAKMRRQHRVGRAPQRMVGRRRLTFIDISLGCAARRL
jgi:hypothetical protein